MERARLGQSMVALLRARYMTARAFQQSASLRVRLAHIAGRGLILFIHIFIGEYIYLSLSSFPPGRLQREHRWRWAWRLFLQLACERAARLS